MKKKNTWRGQPRDKYVKYVKKKKAFNSTSDKVMSDKEQKKIYKQYLLDKKKQKEEEALVDDLIN